MTSTTLRAPTRASSSRSPTRPRGACLTPAATCVTCCRPRTARTTSTRTALVAPGPPPRVTPRWCTLRCDARTWRRRSASSKTFCGSTSTRAVLQTGSNPAPRPALLRLLSPLACARSDGELLAHRLFATSRRRDHCLLNFTAGGTIVPTYVFRVLKFDIYENVSVAAPRSQDLWVAAQPWPHDRKSSE
eukprot:5681548-Prymnesium_polylepis.1